MARLGCKDLAIHQYESLFQEVERALLTLGSYRWKKVSLQETRNSSGYSETDCWKYSRCNQLCSLFNM